MYFRLVLRRRQLKSESLKFLCYAFDLMLELGRSVAS